METYMSTHKGNGIEVRLGYDHNSRKYVVMVGDRLYGITGKVKEAYRLYKVIA